MRISDWSSDVCSSDLQQPQPQILRDVGVLTLFQKNPDVLKSYQAQFRYLLVDEYQDTNVAQYLWLRLLAQGHRNICRSEERRGGKACVSTCRSRWSTSP